MLAHCVDGASEGEPQRDCSPPLSLSRPSHHPRLSRLPTPAGSCPAGSCAPAWQPGPQGRTPPGACSCSCFLRCRSRLVCCPKQRLHRWHLKGFSLVWMLRTCRCRLEEMLKDRSQYLHLKDTRGLREAPRGPGRTPCPQWVLTPLGLPPRSGSRRGCALSGQSGGSSCGMCVPPPNSPVSLPPWCQAASYLHLESDVLPAASRGQHLTMERCSGRPGKQGP